MNKASIPFVFCMILWAWPSISFANLDSYIWLEPSAEALFFLKQHAKNNHHSSHIVPRRAKAVRSELIVHQLEIEASKKTLAEVMLILDENPDFQQMVITLKPFKMKTRKYMVLNDNAIADFFQGLPMSQSGSDRKQVAPSWVSHFENILPGKTFPQFSGEQGTWIYSFESENHLVASYILSEAKQYRLPKTILQSMDYAANLASWHWAFFFLSVDSKAEPFFWKSSTLLLEDLFKISMRKIEPMVLKSLPPKQALALTQVNQPRLGCSNPEELKRLHNIWVLAAKMGDWNLAIQALLVSAELFDEDMEVLESLAIDLNQTFIGLVLLDTDWSIYETLPTRLFWSMTRPDLFFEFFANILDQEDVPLGIKIHLLQKFKYTFKGRGFADLLEQRSAFWADELQDILIND